MPFRDAFTAETSAFDYGCGLHCLANAYILNLKEGRFRPIDEERRSLEALLQGFKAYYPAAHDLTIDELKHILINDLQNPVHREVVLSRVLRIMIQPANSPFRVPGEQIPDDEVQKIANRLRMKTESYSTMEGRVNALYRGMMVGLRRSLNKELNGKLQQDLAARNLHDTDDNIKLLSAECALKRLGLPINPKNISTVMQELTKQNMVPCREKIRKDLSLSPDARDTFFQNRLQDDLGHPPIPRNAPVLKLMNKNGGHWEWEYNLHADDVKNLAEVQAHNLHYTNHPVHYGTNNNAQNAANHADALRDCFNQALLNRRAIYARKQRLTDELNAFEAELVRTQARRNANPHTQPSIPGDSLPNTGPFPWHSIGADAAHPNGFMGLFASLFNTILPIFSAPTGTQAGSTAGTTTSVLQNFFGTLSNFFKPSTPGEGGFGGIAGLLFGWIGQLFGIVGKGAEMLEAAQKADPKRPLSEEERQTPEGALFAKYSNYLPEEAAPIKAKLLADFHNAAIPREKIISDLKNALEQQNLIPELQDLVFNQHLLKIEQPAQNQLRLQYQRSNRSPLAWKNLADHLAGKKLFNEASEVLLQEENRVLNESFLPSSKTSKASSKTSKSSKLNPALKAARDFYESALRHMLTKAPTLDQYNVRRDMLAAIAEGGQDGLKIQANLEALHKAFVSGGRPSSDSHHASDSHTETGGKKATSNDSESRSAADSEKGDFRSRFESVHRDTAERNRENTSRGRDRDRPHFHGPDFFNPFMPGFAAHADRSGAGARGSRPHSDRGRPSHFAPQFASAHEAGDSNFSSLRDFDPLDPQGKAKFGDKVVFGKGPDGTAVRFDLM